MPDPKGPAPANGDAPGCTGTLMVRLWTAAQPSSSDPMFWKSTAPAVSLILDLIAASEGVVAASHGNVLVANFSGIQTAISAARRLQWAVQGFSEGENFRDTAAAILILSAEDQPGQKADTFLPQLNRAKQGQILLTGKSCHDLRNLPGFPLRAASEAGLQELLWRAPEGQSARSFDEQSLAKLIEKRGVSAEARPEAPPAATIIVSRLDIRSPAKADSVDEMLSAASRPSSLGGKKLWLIGGACAAVILVIVVIFAMSHKASAPAADATPAAAPIATPKAATPSAPVVPSAPTAITPPPHVTPPPQPVTPPPQNQPKLSKAELRALKRDKRKASALEPRDETVPPPESKPEPKPAPQRASGRCDLDQQEIADELETAERSLARGNYRDAERQFGAVLACEPGSGRGRAGLDRARKAQTER